MNVIVSSFTTVGPARPTAQGRLLNRAPRGWTISVILVVEVILLTLLSEYFMTATNLLNVTRQAAVIGIVAVGMTYVILLAGIDLSVGSVVGMSGMLTAIAVQSVGSGMVGILVGLGAGASVGVLNGFLVSRLKVQPFIVTLVTLSIARAIMLIASDGAPISVKSDLIRSLGTGRILGIPIPTLLMLLTFIVGHWVLAHTVFGRRIYAVGGNPGPARAAGIRVDRYLFVVYVISGVLSGFAAILAVGRLGTATPQIGVGLELDVIAAVIVGGTSLFGGVGNLWGTLVGVFIIAFLGNGMVLIGISAFWQLFATGVVVLLAVLLDQLLYSTGGH